jgi:hypothetical protein
VQESDETSARTGTLASKRPPRQGRENKRVLPIPPFNGDLLFESPAAAIKQKKELRPAPPPPLMASTSQQGSSRKETSVEKSYAKPKSLRLVPPPVVASTSGATIAPLKQIVAPSFPNPNLKTPSKRLQPIQPPVIPSAPPKPSITGSTDLQSISRAGFGLLNDLSSGNAEELAGILLRDQRPESYAREGHADDSVHRGLDLSPEKKGKGNNPKFLR